MPTSGYLKAGDSLFFSTPSPPPPRKFNEPCPLPTLTNMGMTKNII